MRRSPFQHSSQQPDPRKVTEEHQLSRPWDDANAGLPHSLMLCLPIGLFTKNHHLYSQTESSHLNPASFTASRELCWNNVLRNPNVQSSLAGGERQPQTLPTNYSPPLQGSLHSPPSHGRRSLNTWVIFKRMRCVSVITFFLSFILCDWGISLDPLS